MHNRDTKPYKGEKNKDNWNKGTIQSKILFTTIKYLCQTSITTNAIFIFTAIVMIIFVINQLL